MPSSRQDTTATPPTTGGTSEDELIVRSLGLGLTDGSEIDLHEHPWHQLVYATRGVMVCNAAAGRWVVPPERAVWIPARMPHAIRARGPVTMQTVYLCPGWWGTGSWGTGAKEARRGASDASVVHVSPLLRELVLEVLRLGMLATTVPRNVRLAEVIRDQILGTRDIPFSLPLPTDPRALRVADGVTRNVASRATLAELAQGSGASSRTIERLFLDETGLTLGRWVQRAKALHALELLGSGASVTSAGLSVGYDSTSAFIAMFKKVTGSTPGAYLGSPPVPE